MSEPQLIKQIIQPNQNDSTAERCHNYMDEGKYHFYPQEAKELGIELLEPIPEPISCQFCNKKLYRLGLIHPFKNKIFRWNNDFEYCDCAESIEYWDNYNKEQERIQKEEAEALKRAEFKERVEKLFAQSKLGERFKTRTFKNFQKNNQNQSAYDMTTKYANEFNKYKPDGIGLILNGSYGSGKTHLAAAIANELINKGIPVIFGTTITLLGKLKQSYDKEIKESESEIIDLYSTIDLLVIDDFGKERVNEWVLEKLYLIINSRYENNLPLLITTNYSIDNLPERLSTAKNKDTAEAITSRLWEMCLGIEMNFEDWRKIS